MPTPTPTPTPIRPTTRRPSIDRRNLHAPPTASARLFRRAVRHPHMTRQLALATLTVTLTVSLAVLLGGAFTTTANQRSSSAVTAAAGAQPLPVPTVDVEPCGPGSLPTTCTPPAPTSPTPGPSSSGELPLPTEAPTLPSCDPHLPAQPCAPAQSPSDSPAPTTPCSGTGCVPQPGQPGATAPPNGPGTGQDGQPGQGEAPSGDDCGITDVGACFNEAIDDFFRGLVTGALNPLLDLLSTTLLTTPTPDSLPRVGELWDNSWQILLVSYGLLILIAGVIVMGYQTVQTRHSVKEIAPRLVVGFLAGALSLWVSTIVIQLANGLSQAVMGGGVNAAAGGAALKQMILGSLTGGIWVIFIGLLLVGILVVLLITYVVRVALTIILIAGAPLALMLHALPQTEGIAFWWWKAFGGCSAIQVGQSLTLITAIRVFLSPGGFSVFGPNRSGMVNLLVVIALLYILFKIPFWVLSAIRGGGGRSLIGSMVKGFLAYKTFGLLGGRGGRKGRAPLPSGGGRGTTGNGGGSPNPHGNPHAVPRTAVGGQYVAPLAGVRRIRPRAEPNATPRSGPKPSGPGGRQLVLPLGDDWPENKPVLGRDGQYRLPLDVHRATTRPTSRPIAPTGTDTGARRPRRRGGRQLELPLDPYKGNRPTRSGQYPLPLDLPLNDVRRAPKPPSTAGSPPAQRPGAAPRTGRQLRLPLDLPRPPRFSATPRPSSTPPAPRPAAPPSPKPGGNGA